MENIPDKWKPSIAYILTYLKIDVLPGYYDRGGWRKSPFDVNILHGHLELSYLFGVSSPPSFKLLANLLKDITDWKTKNKITDFADSTGHFWMRFNGAGLKKGVDWSPLTLMLIEEEYGPKQD